MSFTDSLFFAVFPDEAAAARIGEIAARLRIEHKLKARVIPRDRLHITLHYLGAFEGVPVEIVERARRAASSISLAAAEITLDRMESFSGRRARHPLVLAGEASATLAALEAVLGDALESLELAPKRHPHFTPHVTLLYDEHRVARQSVAQPVAWTAHEFALMRSHLGQSRHETLARWPLGPSIGTSTGT